MTTTFENARIGDRVWCMRRGWGTVRKIDGDSLYPLKITYQHAAIGSYTLDGLAHVEDITQTLFWDEVVFKAPSEPVRDLPVDTEVLVWMHPSEKHRRYFSHFNSSRKIHCFVNGKTSWTTKQTSDWLYWELRE